MAATIERLLSRLMHDHPHISVTLTPLYTGRWQCTLDNDDPDADLLASVMASDPADAFARALDSLDNAKANETPLWSGDL